ncbi:MAG: sigma 54-interacting transcriptional regulator [Pirellula sp.]
MHNHSRRSQGPFVIVDCTSIPEALFESTLGLAC